ncbi:MAG: tRNA uridine-5-carboxymethylaminomethyl(34) synthesis GTPase MnmE, partial [Chitinophagaceae bacterium]
MMNSLTGWDDTIVALATPPGIGAIGVIRLSGKNSFKIVNALFPSKDLLKEPPNTLHVGFLKQNDKHLDEVVLSLFRSPRSYTGEDVIEISCHGSPFIHQQIIETCIESGARLAKPGEFTQRAFLNGKMDLAQAEAVADIIASNTEASHKAALHTMRGGFSERLKALREQLIRFSALIELELDFSQEDVEFANRAAFYELINELSQSTNQLIHSFQLGNVIKNGVSVAIIGKPNAGKSTLLNALLNENRAIVSDIPGTTRDTIEEIINIDGILFRLIDTAGIRQHTVDTIEAAGMERSLAKMKQADLVLYLFDARDEKHEIINKKSELDNLQLNYILLANKIDEAGEAVARKKFSDIEKMILISARQNLHTEVLKEKMVDAVLQGKLQTENTVVTNARHYHA